MIFKETISDDECARLHALSRFERILWNRGILNVAGVDEAGRGPLAGPVVAAAVVFPPGTMIAGIDDSKKLTAAHREQLYERIVHSAIAIGIGIVDHSEIDRINILQATHQAMRDALEELQPQPEYILVDGNSFHHDAIPCRAIIKGDSRSISIGAASILAKVTRDRMMQQFHEQYPEYGFDRHKGYCTTAHVQAIKIHGFVRSTGNPSILKIFCIMNDNPAKDKQNAVSTRMKGSIAEKIAESFLQELGYVILEKNYMYDKGEIDIVARDGEVLVFVEVKSKKSDDSGRPEDEVHARKRSQIRRIAEGYLLEHGIRDVPCRCDVVAIVGDEKKHVIRYYKDAF